MVFVDFAGVDFELDFWLVFALGFELESRLCKSSVIFAILFYFRFLNFEIFEILVVLVALLLAWEVATFDIIDIFLQCGFENLCAI